MVTGKDSGGGGWGFRFETNAYLQGKRWRSVVKLPWESYEEDDMAFRMCTAAASIPAISEWGMLTMALLLLTAGKLAHTHDGQFRPNPVVCERRRTDSDASS